MRVLFIVLLLAGCGSGDEPASNNNNGYGFQYDSIGESGMKLRGGPDPSYLEMLYAEVETCTGLSAPAPFVIVVRDGSLSGEREIGGTYFTDPSLVVLDFSKGLAAKHEFIHYLQHVAQGVLDPNHTSPLWACNSYS